jgi:copper chaperone CopZ
MSDKIDTVVSSACAGSSCSDTARKECNHGHRHSHEGVAVEAPSAAQTVQSIFACRGICCSAEIPQVNHALQCFIDNGSIQSVAVDTKKGYVMVRHDPTKITADAISYVLQANHFPGHVLRNGASEEDCDAPCFTLDNQQTSGRSTIFVGKLCCSKESTIIKSIVPNLPGVIAMSFHQDTSTRLIYVDHIASVIGAQEICESLNTGKHSLGALVRTDYAAPEAMLSVWLESTLRAQLGTSSFDDEAVACVSKFFKDFDSKKVDSFRVERASQNQLIVHLIHNPGLLPATDVAQRLSSHISEYCNKAYGDGGKKVEVTIVTSQDDEAEANLDGHNHHQSDQPANPVEKCCGHDHHHGHTRKHHEHHDHHHGGQHHAPAADKAKPSCCHSDAEHDHSADAAKPIDQCCGNDKNQGEHSHDHSAAKHVDECCHHDNSAVTEKSSSKCCGHSDHQRGDHGHDEATKNKPIDSCCGRGSKRDEHNHDQHHEHGHSQCAAPAKSNCCDHEHHIDKAAEEVKRPCCGHDSEHHGHSHEHAATKDHGGHDHHHEPAVEKAKHHGQCCGNDSGGHHKDHGTHKASPAEGHDEHASEPVGGQCCAGGSDHHHGHGGQQSQGSTRTLSVAKTRATSMVESIFRCSGERIAVDHGGVSCALEAFPGIRKAIVHARDGRLTVEHNPASETATDIAASLRKNGFQVEVLVDGGKAISPETDVDRLLDNIEHKVGRSTIFVGKICCAREIPAITQIVEPLHGVRAVSVNVTLKLVYVDHNADIITASGICDSLNKEFFDSEVTYDYAAGQFTMSPFLVETKFRVQVPNATKLSLRHQLQGQLNLLESAKLNSFRIEEESLSESVTALSLVIVHDPILIGVLDIKSQLEVWCDSSRSGCVVTLVEDGQVVRDQNFVLATAANQKGSEESNRCPRPTIVLSGLFWIVSMISLAGGNL